MLSELQMELEEENEINTVGRKLEHTKFQGSSYLFFEDE